MTAGSHPLLVQAFGVKANGIFGDVAVIEIGIRVRPARVTRRLAPRPASEVSRLALPRRSAIYALLLLSALLCGIGPARAQTNVLTYHNDNSRSGLNPNETILNTANVNSNQFGKLFTQPVDGSVFAQPLYLANVNIPGSGTHNVVYIATEHDSVYAFDADDNSGSNSGPLWKTSFLSAGVTTVPDADTGCPDIATTELGITSTPVIDPSTGTIYVVAMTKESGSYVYRLHALDVTTGAEKFGGPTKIQGSVPGSSGTLTFVPLLHLQRSALLLSNGAVYIEWASFCDNGIFHGWVMAYSASTLQQLAIYSDTAYGSDGGIWMSGNGAAADADGNVFLVTGNGTFDATSSSPRDFGDSVLKLALTGGQISVSGYFSPWDEATLASQDEDLGAGGELLLPDQAGSHPHLLVAGGKQGILYLLDRDNLGQFSNNGVSDPQVVQEISGLGGIFSTAAYWNNSVYLWALGQPLKAFALNNGLLSTSPTSQSAFTIGFPGATPSISANGASNGIVWALQTDGVGGNDAPVYSAPAVLHALDATNLAVELYNSQQNNIRDQAGNAVKFTVPTVANGKVYVAGVGQLNAYGVLPTVQVATPTFSPAGGTFSTPQSVMLSDTTPGASIFYTTDGSTPSPASNLYTGPITVSSTTAINAIATEGESLSSAVASAVFTINGSTTPPIILVNHVSAGISPGQSSTSLAAPPADHLAGNLLVVICRNGSNTVSQTAPTDTAGNTFVGLTRATNAGIGAIQMWYAKNINGNPNNVVSCHYASSNAYLTISVLQYAGADTGSPLDSQAGANSGTNKATSGATPALTTSQSGDLVVAGATVGKTGMTFGPGSGFILRDSNIGTFSGDEDQSAPVAGPVVPSMSWVPSAQLWAMVAAAFKPATTSASLVSIAVAPTSPSIPRGLTQQFTATGTYSDGSTQNLTSTATWNSSTPTVATVSAAGLATGVAAGSSSVTATSAGITSNSAVLSVTPPTLVSIAVTPARASVAQAILSRSQLPAPTATEARRTSPRPQHGTQELQRWRPSTPRVWRPAWLTERPPSRPARAESPATRRCSQSARLHPSHW